jgi:hypothetical protein
MLHADCTTEKVELLLPTMIASQQNGSLQLHDRPFNMQQKPTGPVLLIHLLHHMLHAASQTQHDVCF